MTPESIGSCPHCRCLVWVCPDSGGGCLVLDPGPVGRLAIADLVVDLLADDDDYAGQSFAYPGREPHECPPPEAVGRVLDALRGVFRPDLGAKGHDGAQSHHGPHRAPRTQGGPTCN